MFEKSRFLKKDMLSPKEGYFCVGIRYKSGSLYTVTSGLNRCELFSEEMAVFYSLEKAKGAVLQLFRKLKNENPEVYKQIKLCSIMQFSHKINDFFVKQIFLF